MGVVVSCLYGDEGGGDECGGGGDEGARGGHRGRRAQVAVSPRPDDGAAPSGAAAAGDVAGGGCEQKAKNGCSL